MGAEREDGRDATPVADPTRGENRDGCDSVDDSRHEREGGDVAPNVAARLPTLGDDDVNTGRYRPFRLLGAADRVENEPVRGVYPFNVRPRVAPRERDDPQPRLERGFEPRMLIPGEHEIASKRTPRQRRGFLARTRPRRRPR